MSQKFQKFTVSCFKKSTSTSGNYITTNKTNAKLLFRVAHFSCGITIPTLHTSHRHHVCTTFVKMYASVHITCFVTHIFQPYLQGYSRVQYGLVLRWGYILEYLVLNRIVVKRVLFKWFKMISVHGPNKLVK